jgi:hypothetical protein
MLVPQDAAVELVAAVAPGTGTIAGDGRAALATAALTLPGHPVRRIADSGPAVQVLLRAAAHHGAHLLAVGVTPTVHSADRKTHGVAMEVAQRARCSVLMARPAARAFPQSIVVSLDGRRGGDAAVSAAAAIAAWTGAELRALLSSWHLGGDWSPARDALAAAARATRWPSRPRRVGEAIARCGADLVVVADGDAGAVREHVLGATRSSLLVVR